MTASAPGSGDPWIQPPWSEGGAGRVGATVLAAALLVMAGCTGDGEVDQPVPLYGENPIEYPLELWDQGVEGETILRVLVDPQGRVDSVEVKESSGYEDLDEAAVEGARELRFQPGRKDDERVEVWATVPVQFSKRPDPDGPGGGGPSRPQEPNP